MYMKSLKNKYSVENLVSKIAEKLSRATVCGSESVPTLFIFSPDYIADFSLTRKFFRL